MKPRKPIGFSVLACSLMGMLSSPSLAQPGPDGIDWVTVGAPGNAPYQGESDPLSPTYGRGGVNYEYKIGRTEVTTAQWVEFYNAAFARPDPLPLSNWWFRTPVIWGATADPNYQGPGTRFIVNPNLPDAAMIPVGGVSWRTAAVLCNWLTNDKRTDQGAFLSGAYDTSTFTPDTSFPNFNDQREHSPGARYWIPTLDEYLKAAFYDPNANGGAGRWWQQPNMSDIPLVYGPPPSFGGDGTGQANAGFRLPNQAQNRIPLEAYPDVLSPWGLMDLAGGTMEAIEEFWTSSDNRNYRVIDGSARGSGGSEQYIDSLLAYGQDSPHWGASTSGFRLASDVPSPGFLSLVWVCATSVALHRPRRPAHEASVPFHRRRARMPLLRGQRPERPG